MSCLGGSCNIYFEPKDCIRTNELSICNSCGNKRRIVKDLRFISRWKIIWAKNNQ